MRHNTKSALALTVIVSLALVTSGCFSLDSAFSGALDSAVERETERAVAGMVSFDDEMMFNLVYLQVMLVGGFGSGIEDFEPGEGTVWRLESLADGERSTVTAERALLERQQDGSSWWYLRYDAEEQTAEYEALLDSELQPIEMYYTDAASGTVEHHEFDYDPQDMGEDEEAGAMTAEEEERLEEAGADTYVYEGEEYSEIRRGSVQVTVGAGSYTADYLVNTITDEDTGETTEYHWWVVTDVPGDLVKYEWLESESDDTVTGELMSVRSDYTFRLRGQ